MEYLPLLITIFAAHIVLMVTPGPNVLMIAQISASESRKSGLWVAMGVALMGFIWPTLAIIGLNVIFETIEWLYITLKIIGSLYLIYLGYKTWRSAGEPFTLASPSTDPQTKHRFFLLGFLTSLSNPKVLVFMGSFFTVMLPVTSPIWFKILVIMMFGINSLWWHGLVAYAFSTIKIQQIYMSSKTWLERITGGLLIALGMRLMVTSE